MTTPTGGQRPSGELFALRRRWPDATLRRSLLAVAGVYRELLQRQLEERGRTDPAASFGRICGWIEGAATAGTAAPGDRDERAIVAAETRAILARGDGLQALASLLAMLMHFAVDRRTADLLVNRRRPQKPFPTYPTTPALARLVGESVLDRLVMAPTPKACRSAREAHRFAERAYGFRILDPSAESGQLLLGVAEAALARIQRRHPGGGGAARLLGRAVLERLAADVLWGIDRNHLAGFTIRLLFAILGRGYGIDRLSPAHLYHGNTLHRLRDLELADFDGLVNNPPWGVAMGARERQRLRHKFDTVEHRTDLYIPFTEMAVHAVRPGGVLVLILPSQALAARNARRLRALLLAQLGLERLILLPRAAFADATVRAVVVAGRRQPGHNGDGCRVTTFPLVKRLDTKVEARSFELPAGTLHERGERSWSSLLSGGPFTNRSARIVALQQLARVTLGVQVHRVGRGEPPQTRELVRRRAYLLTRPTNGALPAVRGRDVVPFRILAPSRFVRLDKRLSWIGDHDELRRHQRIFVREICSREGRLYAASAHNGDVPLHGVLTVVPQRIEIGVLLAILNSGAAADYVRRHTASFSKVDFQRITVTEMRRFPVPHVALDQTDRRSLGLPAPTARERTLRDRLIALVRKLDRRSSDGEAERERLIEQIDRTVTGIYQLADSA